MGIDKRLFLFFIKKSIYKLRQVFKDICETFNAEKFRQKFDISIITFFIFSRLIKFFLLIFLILNLVIFIINFNKLSYQLGEVGFSNTKILVFCLFLSPLFSFQILPFASFFSTFFCINLMFISNETLSIYSVGYSFKNIIKKSFIFTLSIFIFSIFLQIIFPFFFKKYGYGKTIDISTIITNLKPKILNKLSDDVLMSFDKISSNGEMKNVYIFVKKENNWKFVSGQRAHFVKGSTLRLKIDDVAFFKINKERESYQYQSSNNADIDIDFFNQNNHKVNFDTKNPKLQKINNLISIFRKAEGMERDNILQEILRRILIPIQSFSLALFNIFNLFQMKSSRLEGVRRNIYSILFFISNIFILNFSLGFLVKYNKQFLCIAFYLLFLVIFLKKIRKV